MTGRQTLQRIRDIHPIGDLFFKPRTLFGVDSTAYEQRSVDHDTYNLSRYVGSSTRTELDSVELRFLEDYIGEKTIERRLKRPNCSLFLARETKGGEPVGFYWSVYTNNTPVWHDSFRIPPGSGLVFNAYVAPPHRRQGIYRLLQGACHNYLFNTAGCEQVFTIVEDRNTASMRANEKFGLQIKGKNYLIKFLSINILSVIEMSTDRQTYFVLPKGDIR